MKAKPADRVIIGAGLYGLYAALFCARRNKNEKIYVLECDAEAFSRATYINQARVHMGYHYPRSLSTAEKSAHYYKRFIEDFSFCIHQSFHQIYAISRNFSWTNAEQFEKFCRSAGIRCEDIRVSKYFNEDMVTGGYLTEECTYDVHILRDYFLRELAAFPKVTICYGKRISEIRREQSHYTLICREEDAYQTGFLLNATYASTNILSKMAGAELFKIKYELCEIILCRAGDLLEDTGLTVMDGPFFSIMPFGRTGYHSLTSVTFTPHTTCYEELPTFSCQMSERNTQVCSPWYLGNCSLCGAKPESAWNYMSALAKKYMRPEYAFSYECSLFSMKPVLASAEIDDSRPTIIRTLSKGPTFVTVLSGKINTVYDLEEVLTDEI